MKKIYGIILLGLCILMASCSGSPQQEIGNLVDTHSVSDELKETLGLNNLTVSLNNPATADPNYQNVVISTDLNESLFSYMINLDAIFENNGDRAISANVQPLTFVSGISSDYQSMLYTLLNDSNNGLTKEKLEVEYDLAIRGWSTSVSLRDAYRDYTDGERNQVLAIVYLPIKFVVFESSTTKLDVHIMVPVYYGITSYENNQFADAAFNASNLLTKADLKIADDSTLLGSVQD